MSWAFPLFILPHNYRLRQTIEAPQKKGDGCPPPLQTLPQQPHLGSLTKPTPTRRETVARLPHKLYPKAKP